MKRFTTLCILAAVAGVLAVAVYYCVPVPPQAVPAFKNLALMLAVLIGAFAVYLTPTWIARRRGHPSRTAIFALNLLLGWTFLGWVGSLIWALSSPTRVVELRDTH